MAGNTPTAATPPLSSFHAKLLADKLEHLTHAQRGIGCIARVISEMQIEKNWGDDPPSWWTEYVMSGLLDGVEELTASAHIHLEFLAEWVNENLSKEDQQ